MTRFLSTLARVSTIFVSIFVFLGHMAGMSLVTRGRWERIRSANRWMRAYCRWGLWLLGVQVRVIGSENITPNALFVGNHLSYLDILVLCSKFPTGFVTSMEVKETPLLGQICRMAGCLFVDRRSRENLAREISEITEALKAGLTVTIFPEATSTNGEQILRFRRPLYNAAIFSDRAVIPFCINYRRVGRRRISAMNRDKVMWYGTMPFASHLWRMATAGELEVDLHVLPAVQARDAVEMAETSWAAVNSVFLPVPKIAFGEPMQSLPDRDAASMINLRSVLPVETFRDT